MSGTWMQSVAQNWLVLSLTGSAVDLGITVGLQFGPVLFFGAWGGALADRVDKRKLLMRDAGRPPRSSRLVLGVLVVTDVVTVWMIWVLAGLTGTATWRWASRRSRASCTRWWGRTTSPTPSGSTPS